MPDAPVVPAAHGPVPASVPGPVRGPAGTPVAVAVELPGDVLAALDRQRQIWTNLYGPARAAALIEAAVALRAERPELGVRDLLAALDPERDEDYVDFVATRW